MAVALKPYTQQQAFTLNRFQRVASLYAALDNLLRQGNPQEIVEDGRGNQFRTHAEDKPFSLVFDAVGVYGLYKIRRGLGKDMESQGMGDLAEEIIRDR